MNIFIYIDMRPRREDMGGINRRWNDGERVNHREKKRNI